ncbi:protein FAR1-RELATED SEQUENCE 5-like [Phalaenopsis equestris]|uniref:protein FAR1-RELATED SEQUENCE 5-like n=1 Tax=Phalaenopsis equestris TaxID=78828 RepID=UPI0009E2049E|nr:protein FAR1-RELATED SEQUENCE 5-like [Phalaenopsis equestris]
MYLPQYRAIGNVRQVDLLNLNMEYDYRECQFMFDVVHDAEREDGRSPDRIGEVELKMEFRESNASCTEKRTNILLQTLVRNEKKTYEVYCAYAHHIGFSGRKDHTTFSTNSRIIKTKDFICGKAGFKKELKITETVKYRREETRTGCLAMIRYRVDEEGNWTVKKLIESHNHSLVNPDDKHLLRSRRKISKINADVLRFMTQSENFLA